MTTAVETSWMTDQETQDPHLIHRILHNDKGFISEETYLKIVLCG